MKPAYGCGGEGGGGRGRVTCYVCGAKRCAEYPMAIRQVPSGPYFPFLETHEPPDTADPPSPDGRVLSCSLCYSYLTQQWDLYERDKVPPVKRIYWLKRVDNGPYTGVEVGVQSEYASQLLGLAPDPPPPLEPKRHTPGTSTRPPPPPPMAPVTPAAPPVEPKRARLVPQQQHPPTMPLPPPGVAPMPLALAVPQMCPQQEALDLSLEGRRGTKRGCDEEAGVGGGVVDVVDEARGGPSPLRAEVLDLRMPDKNATTEVCYVCGDHHKKGTLAHIYAKQQPGPCPFFPSLMLHARPSKSHPMEASGRVQACRDCCNHLQLQWDAYEAHKILHSERNYSLRKRSAPVQETTGFVCYKCGRDCPSSALNLVYVRANPDKEPFYPLLQRLEAPEGASPISPQGMVQVCLPCVGAIQHHKRYTDHDEPAAACRSPDVRGSGGDAAGRASTTPLAATATSGVAGAAGNLDAEAGDDEAVCYLCHQAHLRQVMHWLSMVPNPANPDAMHFPFLKYGPRGTQGAVIEDKRVLACSLCHQHLTAQWTEFQKEGVPPELRQFSLRNMPVNSQSPRLTPHSSPAMSPSVEAASPSQVGEAKVGVGGWCGQPIHTLEVVPAAQEPNTPTLPVITTQHALNVAINCFICSFHSKPGQTYAVRCKPRTTEPFFPFLAKHQSAHPEARVDDVHVLVCLCCFHSLTLQWQRYEKAQVDHFARLYDTYNYTCYICSLKTYRKRLYLLPVKDYPFLKEHNRPVGGMVVDNGHSVVVCKDCYSSLKNQYIELERWGVPVEKRQYNWIQRPPPPEFQQDSHATGLKPNQGAQPQLAGPGLSSPGPHPGIPPGGSAQPKGGGSPRGAHGPPPGSSSAVDESSGNHVNAMKVSEGSSSPGSSGIPKISGSGTGAVSTTDQANTPSCYAPLQLKIGVARQGGTKPHAVTKRHTVAPSEGLDSGDAALPRCPPQNLTPVDHLPKDTRKEAIPREDCVSPSKVTTNNHIEDHKYRRSVIRGKYEDLPSVSSPAKCLPNTQKESLSVLQKSHSSASVLPLN